VEYSSSFKSTHGICYRGSPLPLSTNQSSCLYSCHFTVLTFVEPAVSNLFCKMFLMAKNAPVYGLQCCCNVTGKISIIIHTHTHPFTVPLCLPLLCFQFPLQRGWKAKRREHLQDLLNLLLKEDLSRMAIHAYLSGLVFLSPNLQISFTYSGFE
jgi:hypothetical protein